MLLADADRTHWDADLIAEGLAILAGAAGASAGPLLLQAAIAADHARAPSFDATDWGRVVHHYDALLLAEPSPTVAIGRCVALSYLVGPAAGLADLDEVLDVADLSGYPYAHAARAQLLERLDRPDEAAAAWVAAAGTARTDAERSWFEGRSARCSAVRPLGSLTSCGHN